MKTDTPSDRPLTPPAEATPSEAREEAVPSPVAEEDRARSESESGRPAGDGMPSSGAKGTREAPEDAAVDPMERRGDPAEPDTVWVGGTPELRARIAETLKTIYDPEIPVNVYELGLIYTVEIHDGGFVDITMTLTAPGCPVAGPLVQEVEQKVLQVDGVSVAKAELTWDPPWSMERMTEVARLQLGFM